MFTAAMPFTDDSLELLTVSPVIPVVVIDDVENAVPLARALVDGGIRIIEVTLRTAAGLPAIRRIAESVPEILVGAGTVIDTEQLVAVVEGGARFVVTPGSPPALIDAVLGRGLPLLAGAGTLTEMMTLTARGHRAVKFFPAEQSGGAGYLKAVGGPLPGAMFCPTGGITPGNAPEYLALPNVGCVGGSWLSPPALLAAGDWPAITALARQAIELLS
jgi:2-dehydro-3-deoxyphosphogluconate aldolase/(4S)-4-hydroxy-2-oxoglutarate aldolase